MTLDWSISIGSLVNTVLFIGTLVGVYLSILRRLDRLEAKMDTIWAWFVQIERETHPVNFPFKKSAEDSG